MGKHDLARKMYDELEQAEKKGRKLSDDQFNMKIDLRKMLFK